MGAALPSAGPAGERDPRDAVREDLDPGHRTGDAGVVALAVQVDDRVGGVDGRHDLAVEPYPLGLIGARARAGEQRVESRVAVAGHVLPASRAEVVGDGVVGIEAPGPAELPHLEVAARLLV